MPNQTPTRAPARSLALNVQFWLHANTVELEDGRAGLEVYRSTLLKKSSAVYLPVQEFIEGSGAELLSRTIKQDDDMMWCEAEHCLYQLPHSSCLTHSHLVPHANNIARVLN